MGEKKVHITVNNNARGVFAYQVLKKSLDALGFDNAFVFGEGPIRSGLYKDGLTVSYVEKSGDFIRSSDSPVEEELPGLSEIYSLEKREFNLSKLEAIAKTSPVGVIVPSKKWAKKLERALKDLDYDFERVGYRMGFLSLFI